MKEYKTFEAWAHDAENGKLRSQQFPDGSVRWIAAAWDLASRAAYRDAARHMAAILDALPYGREYDRAKTALDRFEKMGGLKEWDHGRR